MIVAEKKCYKESQKSFDVIKSDNYLDQISFEEVYILLRRYFQKIVPIVDENNKISFFTISKDFLPPEDKKNFHDIFSYFYTYIWGYLTGKGPSPWVRFLKAFSLDKKENFSFQHVLFLEYTVNTTFNGIEGLWDFFLLQKETAIKAQHYMFGGDFIGVNSTKKANEIITILQENFFLDCSVYLFTDDEIFLIWSP